MAFECVCMSPFMSIYCLVIEEIILIFIRIYILHICRVRYRDRERVRVAILAQVSGMTNPPLGRLGLEPNAEAIFRRDEGPAFPISCNMP